MCARKHHLLKLNSNGHRKKTKGRLAEKSAWVRLQLGATNIPGAECSEADTTFCNRASLPALLSWLSLSDLAILAFSKRRKSVKSTSSRVRDGFMSRKQPNILVTGTPGTGKTTTCQQVVEAIGFTHINVGDWVKLHELHSGWDEEHDCYIIDEDKVC